jgi:hypothetical protein
VGYSSSQIAVGKMGAFRNLADPILHASSRAPTGGPGLELETPEDAAWFVAAANGTYVGLCRRIALSCGDHDDRSDIGNATERAAVRRGL